MVNVGGRTDVDDKGIASDTEPLGLELAVRKIQTLEQNVEVRVPPTANVGPRNLEDGKAALDVATPNARTT